MILELLPLSCVAVGCVLCVTHDTPTIDVDPLDHPGNLTRTFPRDRDSRTTATHTQPCETEREGGREGGGRERKGREGEKGRGYLFFEFCSAIHVMYIHVHDMYSRVYFSILLLGGGPIGSVRN